MSNPITDAIYDPDRPLNVSPEKWIAISKEREKNLENFPMVDDMDVLTKIDNSLDGIVQYILLFNEAIEEVDEKKLSPEDVAILYKIKDLMDTGVSPYVSDILIELDKLEA